MKKSKKKVLLIAMCASMLAVCSAGGIVGVAESDPVTPSISFAETIKMGDVVEIPEYYAEINGQSVKATANVVTPSGKVYAGSKFTASEAGKYRIEYVVDGLVVHTLSCTANFGATDLISVNAMASIEGIRNYAYLPEDDAYKGVAVEVKNGATITFNNEIVMDGWTKNDKFFEATIEPNTKGDADFSQMYLTVADAENPGVYFKVNITDGHYDGATPKYVSFISAAANGQSFGGLNYNNGEPVWQQKDIYGTAIPVSFRAETYGDLQFSEYSVKLYYDSAENALYTYRYEAIKKVVDFDDPTVFGGSVWSGFESGRAVLSLTFADVSGAGGTVILNTIGGVSLTSESIVDDVAPTLTVDLGGEPKAPNAVLGTEYSIFPYTYYDFYDANEKVDVTVTHESRTGVKTDVSVVDGKFVTNKLGTYTISYVASDYSGNQTVYETSFECVAVADEIVLSNLPEAFSVEAFKRVEVPSVYEVRAYGGNGTLDVTMKVTDPDGQEVALNNCAFEPEKLGVYKLSYTATDYYGMSKTESVNITVVASNETMFIGDIVLPDLLISGFSYTLPQIAAKACSNGAIVNCNIDYYVNGSKLTGNTFTASGSAVTVSCRAYTNDATNYAELTKTVTVVDGQGGKDQTAYFYDKTGVMSVEALRESIVLTTERDATVAFANTLKGSAFSLGLIFDANKAAYDSFNVILCDANDALKTVTLKFSVAGNAIYITTPSGLKTEFPTADGYFKMDFNAETGLISDINGAVISYVDTDDAGNAWTGFSEGIYAKFGFKGVSGESSMSLASLNNQALGYRADTAADAQDTVGPEVEIQGEIALKVKVGDKVTIYSCKGYDVLSQVESVTVKVQAPSGAEVTSEQAADSDFEITVTESGYYRVIYTAYDTAGQRQRLVRNIRVVDSVAPTLTVDFSDMSKKVGDVVSLPTVTAADDSGEVFYDIFLEFPNSEMRLIYHYENGATVSYLDLADEKYPASFKVSDTSFKLEMKGVYTLTVMAYDGDYNVTLKSFKITVA